MHARIVLFCVDCFYLLRHFAFGAFRPLATPFPLPCAGTAWRVLPLRCLRCTGRETYQYYLMLNVVLCAGCDGANSGEC